MHQYRPELIWYASEALARSPFKLIVYQDKGNLLMQDGKASFQGGNRNLQIANIQEVELCSQYPNWPWHIVSATVLFFLLTWRGLPVVIAVPLIACCVLFAFFVGFATKWVRVTYRNSTGQLEFAWFADGGCMGWAGLLGGTRRLCDVLHAVAFKTGEVGSEPILFGAYVQPAEETGKQVEEMCPWCEELVFPDDARCPKCDRPM